MENINKVIEILQAFKEGKTIEYAEEFEEWETIESYRELISLLDRDLNIRIKKELTYRHYVNAEEFLKASKEHGPYIMNSSVYYDIPLRILSQGVSLIYYRPVLTKPNGKLEANFYNYFTLYKEFHWQDGTPCGILEQ